jgi:hypothetical protein
VEPVIGPPGCSGPRSASRLVTATAIPAEGAGRPDCFLPRAGGSLSPPCTATADLARTRRSAARGPIMGRGDQHLRRVLEEVMLVRSDTAPAEGWGR